MTALSVNRQWRMRTGRRGASSLKAVCLPTASWGPPPDAVGSVNSPGNRMVVHDGRIQMDAMTSSVQCSRTGRMTDDATDIHELVGEP
jgi:hypothetical protein